MNETCHLTCSDYYQPFMEPVPGDAPCGGTLDYDSAFIMLQSRLQPKLDAEYGNFVEAAEPINWTDIERDCLALLQKSRDIRLIVILMRCRLRKKGLLALAEGTEAILALLQTWPDDLHPQLLDEGEFEPMLRANAIAELEDISGLLADLRSQALPKASGLQITVREFEKAHQIPREEGALSDDAVAALVHEWHTRARDEIRPLSQAHHFVTAINHTLAESLGQEAPELKVLSDILGMFSEEFGSEAPVTTVQPSDSPEGSESATPVTVPQSADSSPPETQQDAITEIVSPTAQVPRKGIASRADALNRLQEIRSYFAMTEPSSPLVEMLKYAEQSIGKDFTGLQKMYPPEIIALLNHERNEKC